VDFEALWVLSELEEQGQGQTALVIGVGGGIGQGITQITCEYIRKGGDIW